MKIAVLTSLHKKICPNAYGGTELFTQLLVDGLMKRGHEVTLFASADSETSARLIPSIPADLSSQNVSGVKLFLPYQLQMAEKAVSMQEEFDIIHNSFYENYMVNPFLPFFRKPVVSTVHNDFFRDNEFRKFFSGYGRKTKYVFVSEFSRHFTAGMDLDADTVYNGIEVDGYPFRPEVGDYLFWISRVSREKGIEEAIQATKAIGKKLIMSGVVGGAAGEKYLSENVKPLLDADRIFRGPCTHEEKLDYYGNAKAFLFPILWEEPFGLVLLEAMATGTPVIAYARGAIPEVIDDGKTGFLVNPSDTDIRGNWITKINGSAGIIDAINRLYSLSPSEYMVMQQHCRKRVMEHFSAEKMVGEYERIYRLVLRIT